MSLQGSGLVLQIGTGETLAIQANGTFPFPTSLVDGTRYDIKVTAQPSSPVQSCQVSNGTGTVSGVDVPVFVFCETAKFSIGGNLVGLVGSSLTLWVQKPQSTPVLSIVSLTSNGAFKFPEAVTDGSPYEIQLGVQPAVPFQTCSVANGSGTVNGGDITNISVTCTTTTYALGGTVTGLHGHGLVLRNNGGNDIAIDQDGAFTFSNRIDSVTPIEVTVAVPPTNLTQTCHIINGSYPGVGVFGGDFLQVRVECTATQQLGTASDDEALAVTSRAPDVFVVGRTKGAFAAASNAGGWDAFLIRFNSSGAMRWKRQFGTGADDSPKAIRAATGGATYIVGSTGGSLGGPTQGSDDIFVTKFDIDGNQVWTRQFGTTSSDAAEGLTISSDNSIYISGHTNGNLDGVSAGGSDLFVAKLDANGTVLWLRQLGTPADDAAYGIDVDANGIVYVVGGTQGNLDGHTNASGGEMGFIVRYDATGTKVGTQLVCESLCNFPPSGTLQSRLNGVVAGFGGDFDVTGWMKDGPSTSGPKGFLIAQFDAGFMSFYGRILETVQDSMGTSIAAGPADGGIYVTGYRPLTAVSDQTYGFVRRVSAADLGNQQYETRFQPLAASASRALGVTVLAGGDTFVVGRTQQGVDGNTSLGGYDMYIAHLNEVGQIQ